MTRKITRTVVVASAVALIIFDIVIAVEPTPNDTISELIHEWAERWTVVPWLVGLLAGHWFWPYPPLVPKPWRYCVLLNFFLALLAVNIWYGGVVQPIVAMLIGVPCGGLIWGLDDA